MAAKGPNKEQQTNLNLGLHEDAPKWISQYILDRPKRIESSRRYMKYTAIAQISYTLVRTAWKYVPTLITGEPLMVLDVIIVLLGIGLFTLYLWASGHGNPEKENDVGIMTYCTLSLIFLAECFISFWTYHVLNGPDSEDPHARDTYPYVTTTLVRSWFNKGQITSTQRDQYTSMFAPIEGGVEMLGLFIIACGVWFSKELIVEKREAIQKEAAGHVQEEAGRLKEE